MKSLRLIVIGIILFLASSVKAQVNDRVNIGSPPAWGPVGYSDARYYYLPDLEVYYDVQTSMFIYYEGRGWVRSSELPSGCRHYNLYKEYKVVITDYNGDTPYVNFSEYRTKYVRHYHGDKQVMIGKRHVKENSYERIALIEKQKLLMAKTLNDVMTMAILTNE